MNLFPDHLDMPPFPSLVWDDCDWWDGIVDLSFGANAVLTVTPYDPSVSRIPSAYQSEALAFHLDEGERVFSVVLGALQAYYEGMRPRYRSFLGDGFESLMPALNNKEELIPLIDLREAHIHPWHKGGVGYVGLQFGCSWDQEHGLGLLMHLDRVVEIGGADVSFAWSPDEADAP
ncbi:hypothetical protein OVA24_16810 [Luteolibacter sp. SL250]|uniref:DUF6985 domain-containing protein n=1 Tax=Luteolibacter sp. SL250 TaxID=2995170 RepID=UPI0022718556|nr:hypothetical protein [Luteolibacter sp. SL250]WAC18894.1 hypothetical protein OVA24_16810 [Luteolibacter sp. SL250]